MKSKINKISILILLFIVSTNIFAVNKSNKEFRGVWVASVGNIDWPSKQGLSESTVKREFLDILDDVERWNLNAVVVQVKPAGDAFYPSKYSSWSKYLTGKQGVNPGWDPLEFMIKESHKRGIEFHAWFNPYRLSTNTNYSELSEDNISKKHPEWVVEYGGKLYLNPGAEGVNDYIINSIMEVVENYDIDAVHMDDYFYPYPDSKSRDYPDNSEYQKYGTSFSNKGDWRRDNVNSLIKELSKEIKEENSNVELGISPFGVWRNKNTDPNGSDTNAGIQNYDDLYADVLLWAKKGWIDYLAPQLYWHSGHNTADYNTLVQWWSKELKNTPTNLYIGQGAYKVDKWDRSSELVDQIIYNRQFDKVDGSIFFSYKSLKSNPRNIVSQLVSGPYKDKSLVSSNTVSSKPKTETKNEAKNETKDKIIQEDENLIALILKEMEEKNQ